MAIPSITSYEPAYKAEELNIQQGMFISSLTSNGPYIPTIKNLLGQYSGQSGWDAQVAYDVMMEESGGNIKATNWKDNHKTCMGSFGLFQLACLYGEKEDLYNPETNVKTAFLLWKKEGWKPWSVCTNGIVDCF